MEYLGFFALVALGVVLVGVSLLVFVIVYWSADRPTRREAIFIAVVTGLACSSGAWFLWSAYAHAPFAIVAR